MKKMDNVPTLLMLCFVFIWMVVSVTIVVFLAIAKLAFKTYYLIKNTYQYIKKILKPTLQKYIMK